MTVNGQSSSLPPTTAGNAGGQRNRWSIHSKLLACEAAPYERLPTS